jgi:hypothetical protein
MKKYLFLMAMLSLLMAACSPSAEEKSSKEKAMADRIAMSDLRKADSVASYEKDLQNELASQTADKEVTLNYAKGKEGKDQRNTPNVWDSAFIKHNSNRKLIKTASLNFEVADVEKTTVKIEHLANNYGGFILSSSIKNTTSQVTEQRINKDSVLEIGLRNIQNDITLRVPEFLLDTVLFGFSKIWTQLNERTINAEDVTIDFLANELRARMYQKTATNINQAAQNNQKKLDNVVDAEQTAAQYLESTIQKKIQNLTLQDRIDYATITIHIYQEDVLYKKKKVSYQLEDYQPSFGSEFVDSLAFGWKIILGFILFITKCWSLLLIMVVLFFAIYLPIRYAFKKKKKAQLKS